MPRRRTASDEIKLDRHHRSDRQETRDFNKTQRTTPSIRLHAQSLLFHRVLIALEAGFEMDESCDDSRSSLAGAEWVVPAFLPVSTPERCQRVDF